MRAVARPLRTLLLGASVIGLSACDRIGALDFDLRGGAGQFDTSSNVRAATNAAPVPDSRGVVSYPGYQVALARRGDTVADVAARVGIPAGELSRFNALPESVALREGEIIALPRRVGVAGTSDALDVTSIAGAAIDRAEGAPAPAGDQPQRHRVEPGETAFSIARRYDVPVAALSEWNGLGPDLQLRVGQFLLIPTRTAPETAEVEVAALPDVSAPGVGTATPLPPSAATALPAEDVKPVEETAARPEPPKPLADTQTEVSDTSRLRMPVNGQIVRPYAKGSNEGIGIAASAGTAVAAADDGVVAAITRDTDQVPIMVLRHEGNLLTVYAGVDNITVEKGDSVKRGQKIAEVRAASPSFLHFEVREGFDSVDPVPYLN